MNLVILGGAGFIGLNFLKLLSEDINSKQYNITVIDKGTYASNLDECNNILTYSDNISGVLYIDDIADLSITSSKTIQQADLIINFAAETHVDNSIQNAKIFIDSNIVGTFNIINLLSTKGRLSKYIHISTDEVYGSLGLNDFPSTEESNIEPNSPYSASKASSDMLVRSYVKTHNFPGIITRCCNNFGTYQHNEKLIPTIINKIKSKGKIPIYGNGQNIREWIDVRDHCRAIKLVMEQGEVGEVYNIGSGVDKTNIDIAKSICSVMDYPIDNIEFVQDRRGHDFRYALNSSKIQNELGFYTKYKFNETITELVEWYDGR